MHVHEPITIVRRTVNSECVGIIDMHKTIPVVVLPLVEAKLDDEISKTEPINIDCYKTDIVTFKL